MWSYLVHPALQTRYAVAAALLRGEDVIVEVGGYKTPISQFLTHAPREVVVIDPLLDRDGEETQSGTRVRYHRSDFNTLDLSAFPADTYSVVFLGMDMHNPEASELDNVTTFARFLGFTARARSAVIEYPVGWSRAARQFEVLLSVLHPRVEFDCLMDFTQSPIEVPGLADADRAGRLRRRIVWLKEMTRPTERELTVKVARNLYGRAAEALTAQVGKDRTAVPDGVMWSALQVCNNTVVRGTAPGIDFSTPAEMWSYSVLLPLAIRHLPADQLGLVRLTLSVEAGVVGIGFLTTDGRAIHNERLVRSNPGVAQTLEMLLPASDDVTSLVIRTGDSPGPASVSIRGVDLYRLVDR
jgi:hypothetical protein